MIRFTFFSSEDRTVGFRITGHAGYSEEGRDIICAAVSSAAYMTANTVTDVLDLDPELSVAEGDMLLRFRTLSDADNAAAVMDGFRLHIMGLLEQYPDFLTVTITEV